VSLNYVDSVTALYPKVERCQHCSVVIDHRTGRWTDNAGQHWCQSGPALVHVPAPYAARSSTLGGLL